jgi:hypothetical protein
LEVIAIDKLSFYSDVVAITKAPEGVDLRSAGVERQRDRDQPAVSLSYFEHAALLIDSLHGSFNEFGS